MTDDFDAAMAERLANAGERWREVHADAATMKPEVFDATQVAIDITPAPSAPRRRRWNAWAAGISSVAAAAIAVLVAVNIQGGGSGQPGTEAIDTAGGGIQGQWVLRSMTDSDGKGVRVIEPAPLQVTDTTIGGTDGCNHIGGDVTFGGTSFDLGQGLATTDMACIDRPAGFDEEVQLIHSVLTGTVHFSITGDLLTLTGPTGAKLSYARDTDAVSTTDPRALIGTWSLDTVGGDGPDGTASSAILGSGHAYPSLQFNGDGTYFTQDGCNGGGGDVTTGAGSLLLKPGVSTLIACGGAIDVQAHQFDAVLDGAVVWSIKNGQLMITKKNVGYLVFTNTGLKPGQGPAGTGAPDQPTSTGAGGSDPGSGGGGSTGSTGSAGEPAATASDLPLNS